MYATLDGIIQFPLPLSIRISTFSRSSFLPHISDYLVTECGDITSVTQYFSTTTFPVKPTLDWETEYSKDTDTHAIMTHLITHKLDNWPKSILSNIASNYHVHLKRGYLQLYNDHLVWFKPILMESRYIDLFVVPAGLRRQLLSRYHAGLSGGYMG